MILDQRFFLSRQLCRARSGACIAPGQFNYCILLRKDIFDQASALNTGGRLSDTFVDTSR